MKWKGTSKCIIVLAISTVVTGCSSQMMGASNRSDGGIMIESSAEGMRAFGDVLNGMISNGKASPDQDTAHWQFRKTQEQTQRMKYAVSLPQNKGAK